MNKNNSIRFTWDEMDKLHRRVGELIKAEKFKPEIIVGILRCGMVSAIHLAYILEVDLVGEIYVLTTPSDEIVVKKQYDPIVTSNIPLEFIKDKRVLLVDAVMASGTTINLSLDALLKYHPAIIKLAIITDWPTSPYKLKSGKRPQIDFIGIVITKWADFPWER